MKKKDALGWFGLIGVLVVIIIWWIIIIGLIGFFVYLFFIRSGWAPY